jgi:hypothetical protein
VTLKKGQAITRKIGASGAVEAPPGAPGPDERAPPPPVNVDADRRPADAPPVIPLPPVLDVLTTPEGAETAPAAAADVPEVRGSGADPKDRDRADKERRDQERRDRDRKEARTGESGAEGRAPEDSERGRLIIFKPLGAQVLVDGADTGRKVPIPPRNALSLSPGVHRITLVTSAGQFTYPVTIEAGKTKALSPTIDP